MLLAPSPTDMSPSSTLPPTFRSKDPTLASCCKLRVLVLVSQSNVQGELPLGFRVSYLASKASPEVLAESLNLTIGNPENEMPVDDWWIAKIKNSDWTLLWSESEDFGQNSVGRVAELSKRYETYICDLNETVMWSSAEFWKDGRQIWKVTHAGDGDDIFDLSETGATPQGFSELKQMHIAAQQNDGEDVDHIFEIPLDLAALDFGFRHEHHLEQSDVEAFLTIARPQRKSLFSRVFGR